MSKPTLVLRDAQQPAQAQWQRSLREAFRTVPELLGYLQLEPLLAAAFEPSKTADFPLLVPRSFAARMVQGDPDDPLLRQVLPDIRERHVSAGYLPDPLAETDLARHGVLRKYAGRALLVTTGACPVHCRYCFRRHFPYHDQLASRARWAPALAELRTIPDLHEVILSGGDPLSLSNRSLAALILGIEQLASVHTLRIHSRFPIILPERIDPDLCELLARTRLKVVMVVHCNHANELDDAVREALRALRSSGILLLNQSVLLEGVNANADALADLSRRLFDCDVLPYYLHLLDPVAGAAHFDVAEDRARALTMTLRRRLPGYLVPRLVREEAGGSSKTVVL